MILIGLEVKIRLFEAYSLKDKRRVIRSILQKTQQTYKVSASEVGALDLLNYAELGFGVVSNDYRLAKQILTNILNFIEENYPVEIVEIEWVE